MTWRGFASLVLLAASFAAPAARAAEMKLVPQSDGRSVIMTVQGEFKLDDGARFAALVKDQTDVLVVFNSPGGALIAGLQMGQLIHLKHFRTFVPQGALCASACAIAWLGGVPRIMQPGSHVGFHQAFYGAHQVAGVGNALMGAYMAQLGFGFPAIEYFEKAAPQSITWLTAGDAQRLGIQLIVLPFRPEPRSAPAPAPAPAPIPGTTPAFLPPGPVASPRLLPFLSVPLPPPAPTPTPASLAARARLLALEYFSHWSAANASALDYFARAYGNDVVFYGSALPRATLMAAKERFATNWPIRVYSVRPSSTRVFCDPATRRCAVTGVVDWDCRDPARRARTAGRANFMLVLSFADVPTGVVIGEAGSVISRTD